MLEVRDFCDRPIVYARAEPDDEYDKPDTLDPYLTDEDESDILDEEELDEDEI
jgi:hypothetical protein